MQVTGPMSELLAPTRDKANAGGAEWSEHTAAVPGR